VADRCPVCGEPHIAKLPCRRASSGRSTDTRDTTIAALEARIAALEAELRNGERNASVTDNVTRNAERQRRYRERRRANGQ